MIIAHLPVAYLAATGIRHRTKTPQMQTAWSLPMIACLIGGIAPDFDLLYFYTIGGRHINHHAYITHTPFYWACAATITFVAIHTISDATKRSRLRWIAGMFFVGILTHHVLDSFVGWLYWFYPFSDQKVGGFVVIPSIYSSWWLWNFILHWTFLVELTIVTAAGVVWWRSAFAESP